MYLLYVLKKGITNEVAKSLQKQLINAVLDSGKKSKEGKRSLFRIVPPPHNKV